MDNYDDMLLFDSQQLNFDTLLDTLVTQAPASRLRLSEDTLDDTFPVNGIPASSSVPDTPSPSVVLPASPSVTLPASLYSVIRAEMARFPCPVPACGNSYKHQGDVTFHIRNKHSIADFNRIEHLIPAPQSCKINKTFCCPITACICGYMRLRDLRRHIKQKHPNLIVGRANTRALLNTLQSLPSLGPEEGVHGGEDERDNA